jgi:hypothetical protein
MSSNPPPRRPRRASNGEPSLPIIPILIGVIVLGFVIGAGLSLAGRHDMTVVALASPSAAASETLAPVTPAPTEKPAPEPSPGATDAPASAAPVAAIAAVAATPRARPSARATSSAIARATGAPAVALAASTAPVLVHPAAVVTEAAAAPAPASTPPAVAADAKIGTAAANPNAASSVVEADSAFAKLSAAVVRQYLEAVKRGDQDGAYAALGTTPGAKGATLTEAAVVDSQTRVGRIDAHSAANDNALVSVQLQTPNGPYYGQYTVHKTDTGAAVIVAHSIVKP